MLYIILTIVLSLILNFDQVSSSKSHLFETRQVSNYPPLDVPGPTPKDEWIKAYEYELQAGNIPRFAPSIKLPSGAIQYDPSLNPLGDQVCSWTMGCRSDSDINNAPDGMMGISFDDGPQGPATDLLKFLASVNQTATHFMIGSRILSNPQSFAAAVQQGDHIAVHTWSHPMMSTLSDHAVLGEIGWTMQVIYDLSGGKIPAWWRPPYGDTDNRVRAIAKNVFGLQTVIWNHDTNDWCISPQDVDLCAGNGPANVAAIVTEMSGYIGSPKSPGLIILEHELTTYSVAGFSESWANIKSAGWDTRPLPALFNKPWYQNARGPFDVPVNSTTSMVHATPIPLPNATTSTVIPTATASHPITQLTSTPVVLKKTSASNTHRVSLGALLFVLVTLFSSS